MPEELKIVKKFLSPYEFHAEEFTEDNGSVTLSLDEIDLVENGADKDKAKKALAQSILDYAEDYYNEFPYWSSDPVRKKHIPYVLKALLLNDASKIEEFITCRRGNN